MVVGGAAAYHGVRYRVSRGLGEAPYPHGVSLLRVHGRGGLLLPGRHHPRYYYYYYCRGLSLDPDQVRLG